MTRIVRRTPLGCGLLLAIGIMALIVRLCNQDSENKVPARRNSVFSATSDSGKTNNSFHFPSAGVLYAK